MPSLAFCPPTGDLGDATPSPPAAEDGRGGLPARPDAVIAPEATTRRLVLPVAGPGGAVVDWEALRAEAPGGLLAARVLVRDPCRPSPAQFDGTLDGDGRALRVDCDPQRADPPLAPGIYDAEAAVLDPTTGRPAYAAAFYLAVEGSLFGDDGPGPSGPPTVGEMRLYLRDADPGESRLLGRLLFSDAEILLGLRRAVDLWNASPPHVPALAVSTRSFPSRERWRQAAQAWLYRQAGEHYQRNHLAYSAAGLAVDDTSKFAYYAREGARLEEDFRAWVLSAKSARNREAFYGTVPGAL